MNRFETAARTAAAIFLLLSAAGPASALERPEIRFDEKTWVVANQGKAGDVLVVEFVPEGQTLDNWKELVTTQFYVGFTSEGGVDGLVEKTRKNLMQKCPALRWKILRRSPGDVTYEWSVDACKGVDDQGEIARAIQGREGIHVLHYALKKSPIPSDKRAEWTKRLQESRLLQ